LVSQEFSPLISPFLIKMPSFKKNKKFAHMAVVTRNFEFFFFCSFCHVDIEKKNESILIRNG
jgi:hypothetical protein